MKYETQNFKVNYKDFALMLLFMMFVGLLLISVISAFRWGNTKNSYITIFVFLIIYSTFQSFGNRSGVLKISGYQNQQNILDAIEKYNLKHRYIKTVVTDEIIYVRRTKLGRFFDYFFNEKVTVKTLDNEIDVYCKKNFLWQLEMDLKLKSDY